MLENIIQIWFFQLNKQLTTAAIAETGFLTNPSDRKIIVAQSKKSAAGLVHVILQFLYSQHLIETVSDLETLMRNT